ncbi:vegetative cell wall protein gp1-like [Ostrinia furnacalis]|uniref:vegetative cell wall protein gp1-like n=1 Tax=Ostrinia furnacalis TaxID=93504 RepID=UPI00103AD2EF|nr:vegetative cell wall protein gp1-like [Ostrinia furnacalis]
MMVETMLESSQDFGMSNGALPQWKRELLQRRAARSRPAPPAPAPAPAPAAAPAAHDDDEELPTRRPAPAARVSAVLRGLEAPSRTSTPEPRDPQRPAPRSPTPPLVDAVAPAPDEPEAAAAASTEARPVSRAALEGIARAGSSMRFAFEAPRRGSHLPPLAAANPVLVGRARRVGVIRPMPAPAVRSPEPQPVVEFDRKVASPPPTPRLASPPPEPDPTPQPRPERREPPPAAMVEPIPRSPPETADVIRPESPADREPEIVETRPKAERPLTNGFAEPRPIPEEPVSRLGGADIERAWNGSSEKRMEPREKKPAETKEARGGAAPWAGGSPGPARRPRAPPPAATSIVFNFSDRKEVPDYIENDGIILRGSRRNKIKVSL